MKQRIKTRKGKIREVLTGIAGLLGFTSVVCAGPLNWGYNTAELGLTDEGVVRARAINNVKLDVGAGYSLGFHGLNQIEDGDTDTYNGVNRLHFGENDADNRALLRVKTNKDGAVSTRAGARNTRIPKLFRCGGYVDGTTDKDGANVTAFLTRRLGEDYSASFMHSLDLSYDGSRPKTFAEIQLERAIFRKWKLFGRAEVADRKIRDAKYLAGIGIDF